MWPLDLALFLQILHRLAIDFVHYQMQLFVDCIFCIILLLMILLTFFICNRNRLLNIVFL